MNLHWPTYLLTAAVGLCLGSFANVVIDRLPGGRSLVRPGSMCDGCGRGLVWWELIPLLGYALVRGRCRTCGAAIGWRSPVVEAVMGLAAVVLMTRLGLSTAWAVGLAACLALICLAVIDFNTGLLPDALTVPLTAAGLIWHAGWGLGAAHSLIGLAVCGGLLAAVRWGYLLLRRKEGMGGGDPKLAAALGAWLGAEPGLWAVVAGAACGALVGVVLILSGRAGWKSALPFGPFLALGGLAALLTLTPL